MYVDTHCHLDNDVYKDNINSIISNALSLKVNKFVIPGADINTLQLAIKLSKVFDGVYFACGVHPNEAKVFNNEIKSIIESNINNQKCVAIGEIGLDYHYFNQLSEQEIIYDKKLQEDVFRAQIEMAIAFNKPIIIHTRDSNKDLINILRDYQNNLRAVLLHCFGGDEYMIDSLKCEMFYGIGGIVTFKNADKLRDCIYKLPLDSIVLETDAPYLAPTPYRGKINTPEYIPIINSYLSNLLNLSIDNMAMISTNNAMRLFFNDK